MLFSWPIGEVGFLYGDVEKTLRGSYELVGAVTRWNCGGVSAAPWVLVGAFAKFCLRDFRAGVSWARPRGFTSHITGGGGFRVGHVFTRHGITA